DAPNTASSPMLNLHFLGASPTYLPVTIRAVFTTLFFLEAALVLALFLLEATLFLAQFLVPVLLFLAQFLGFMARFPPLLLFGAEMPAAVVIPVAAVDGVLPAAVFPDPLQPVPAQSRRQLAIPLCHPGPAAAGGAQPAAIPIKEVAVVQIKEVVGDPHRDV